VLASYIGARGASETNIVLNRGPYTLAPYVLLDAKISTEPLHVFRGAGQQIVFALSGKNLLGARGPSPGFTGVDYPLAPRAVLLEAHLAL
jgi:outer membrane receptor for ferrienterochelin and colicins